MLNFKANRLIRKPYEVAYYGRSDYMKKIHENDLDIMDNPFKPVYSPFPVAVDIVRSIMNRKKFANKISDKIINLLFIRKLVTSTKMHLYTLFVTTPNCTTDGDYHIIDKRNLDRSPFTSYHKSLQNIRKDWTRSAPYLHDLVTAIETTFGYRVSFNVHAHGLLGSSKSLTATNRAKLEARASHQMSHQMNNEAVTVHIKPFKDECGSHLKSVKAFIHYILKQYHLPVMKNLNDYHKFMKRPAKERHALVTSLLNSTKGSRALTYSVSIKSRFIKSLLTVHTIVQPSLLVVPTTSQVQSAPQSSHHYTSEEQWKRAESIQHSQSILKLGQKLLAKALLDTEYIIIDNVNKKATNKHSGGQYIQLLSNIFKVTGIPP